MEFIARPFAKCEVVIYPLAHPSHRLWRWPAIEGGSGGPPAGNTFKNWSQVQVFPGIWFLSCETTLKTFFDSATNQEDSTIRDKDFSLFTTFSLSCDHLALLQCAKKIGHRSGVASAAPAPAAVTTLFGPSALWAMSNQPVEFQVKCSFQSLKEMLHCLC